MSTGTQYIANDIRGRAWDLGSLSSQNESAQANILAGVGDLPVDRSNRHRFGTQVAQDQKIDTVSSVREAPDVNTTIIEIFEGVVQDVNRMDETMSCTLRSLRRGYDDHVAEMDLEWVHPQDMELVVPGAVFYLTLYKEFHRGTLRNTEEIRFRRLPAWSGVQVKKATEQAALLHQKIKRRTLLD